VALLGVGFRGIRRGGGTEERIKGKEREGPATPVTKEKREKGFPVTYLGVKNCNGGFVGARAEANATIRVVRQNRENYSQIIKVETT